MSEQSELASGERRDGGGEGRRDERRQRGVKREGQIEDEDGLSE